MSYIDEIDANRVEKSFHRRQISLISEEIFGDYEETYGKDADAKLLSFKQLAAMKETMKEIISTIGIKRSELSSDIALELISETYYDLIELLEVLKVRIEIAKIVMQNKELEDFSLTFAESYDLDILRAILHALKEFSPEELPCILDQIFTLTEDYGLYDIYASNIFDYQKARRNCAFPRVFEFLDENFYILYGGGLDLITAIIDEYSKSKVGLAFSDEVKSYLIRQMPFLEGTDVFDEKNESSLIKLVNALFIKLREAPQFEERSFDPLATVLRQEDLLCHRLKVDE